MNHVHAIRGWVAASRKRLVTTIGLLLAMTAAGAYAAFLLFQGIGGAATAVDMNSVWSSSTTYTPTVVSTSTQYGGTCDIVLVNNNGVSEVDVTMDGIAPGDRCEFQAAINYASDIDLAMQAFDLVTNDPAVYATLDTDCGVILPATPDGAQNHQFTWTIHVTSDIDPGETVTFDRLGDGVTIVPTTDYDSGACA